jgi:hypothetical protein
MKAPKQFKVTKFRGHGSNTEFTGTLPELIKTFSYTLETGASYAHEKGNKKINREPKGIKSLITNLNNAVQNSAANGYTDIRYNAEEIVVAVPN